MARCRSSENVHSLDSACWLDFISWLFYHGLQEQNSIGSNRGMNFLWRVGAGDKCISRHALCYEQITKVV